MRQDGVGIPSAAELAAGWNAGIIIFTGRFGSGKTETALNYARAVAESRQRRAPDGRPAVEPAMPHASADGRGVTLVDLDIVTPYFRSREAGPVQRMRDSGVEVIAPAAVGQHLDTPAITPQILGAMQQEERLVILDVGGDPQGARALGQFSAAICHRGYTMHFVVNPYRPFTQTLEELARSISQIEQSARLRVSSLVSNPHLALETTTEHIRDGHSRIEAFARQLDLPVAFVCLERRWASDFGLSASDARPFARGFFAQPVLVLDRHFVMFWE